MEDICKTTNYALFVIMLFALFAVKSQGDSIYSQSRDIIYLREENKHLKDEIQKANEYYEVSGCVMKGGKCGL